MLRGWKSLPPLYSRFLFSEFISCLSVFSLSFGQRFKKLTATWYYIIHHIFYCLLVHCPSPLPPGEIQEERDSLCCPWWYSQHGVGAQKNSCWIFKNAGTGVRCCGLRPQLCPLLLSLWARPYIGKIETMVSRMLDQDVVCKVLAICGSFSLIILRSFQTSPKKLQKQCGEFP